MKFQCDRCKTRYSIADEKVRGKILKIRCKSCEAVITVRDAGGGAEGPRLVAGPATTAPAQPVISTAGGKARVRPPAKTIELAALSGSMAAQPEPATETPPPADPAEREWYLSVDGAQEGPFSAEEAQRRVAGKAAGVEMFAWRDDFTDWLPVEEVPVLAVHIRRLPPPPPRRKSGTVGIGTGSSPSVGTGSTAPARAASSGGVRVSSSASGGMPALALSPTGTPALASSSPALSPAPVRTPIASPEPQFDPLGDPLHGRDRLVGDATEIDDPFEVAGRAREPEPTPPPADSFDFQIGEASRVVKLPILPPAASNPPPATAVQLPGVSRPRADESLQLPIVDASQGNLATVSADAKPVAPSRRRRLIVPLALGGAAVVAVLIGVVVISRGGEDRARGASGDVADNLLVNDFYRKDNPLLGREGSVPASAPAATAADKAAPGGKGAKTVASMTPARPGAPGRIDPSARPEPARIGPAPAPGRPTGKADTFDEDSGPADPLTPDDVRNTYAANEVGLKRCYERSLKADPNSSVTKMIVKITISSHGNISEIAVPDRTDLGSCVANSIRSWRFRRSNGEFTTEFTVFFARRG